MSRLLRTAETSGQRVVFERGNDAVRLQYALTCGDNREILCAMPDNSVDLAVTSPPYFSQREYSSVGLGNEATVEEYLAVQSIATRGFRCN